MIQLWLWRKVETKRMSISCPPWLCLFSCHCLCIIVNWETWEGEGDRPQRWAENTLSSKSNKAQSPSVWEAYWWMCVCVLLYSHNALVSILKYWCISINYFDISPHDIEHKKHGMCCFSFIAPERFISTTHEYKHDILCRHSLSPKDEAFWSYYLLIWWFLFSSSTTTRFFLSHFWNAHRWYKWFKPHTLCKSTTWLICLVLVACHKHAYWIKWEV